MYPIARRTFLAGTAASGFALTNPARSATLRVEALFAGRIDDKGFMEAGYRGLVRARDTLGATIGHIEGVKPQKDALAEALRTLAGRSPDLVIAHGGQNNEAAKEVAAAYPALRFAVTQGAVSGPNLASYEVLQEQSAFLAGVFAALTTKSKVIGHMSGIRVKPGLKGRAAFLAGAKHADPSVRVLTNFSGDQDNNALSRNIAEAMIATGADVIFTMLNAGRGGVTEACRARGAAQIGNVGDWTLVAPDVFSASAVADVSTALFAAAKDTAEGRFTGGRIQRIGLENEQAVRLAMRADTPALVRTPVDETSKALISGAILIPEDWTGEEFKTPA